MDTINIESLLDEITPAGPADEGDLVETGNPDFIALEIMMKAVPEPLFDAKPNQEVKAPDWGDIQSAAIQLLTRSHDLRVAVFLTRALLHNEGVQGLKTGLTLVYGLVRRYWDRLYPRLDPDDNHDPTIRNTALELLSTGEDILGPLKRCGLCESPTLGQFNYRDVMIAQGKIELPPNPDEPLPGVMDIEAAFKDTDTQKLYEKKEVIHASLEILAELTAELDKKIGDSGSKPDFKNLRKILKDMDDILKRQLKDRPIPNTSDVGLPPQAAAREEISAVEPDDTNEEDFMRNVIHGRQDVVRLIDLICSYYHQNEPGSPVPLLLKRARQLVGKSFVEIIQDLAPDSAAKINSLISGAEKER